MEAKLGESIAGTPSQLVEAFVLNRKIYGGHGGCTEQTLATYRHILNRWAAGCGSYDRGDMDIYLGRLQGSVGQVTYVKHLRHLRAFFRWSHEVNGSQNPLQGVSIREPLTVPTTPNKAQVASLLAICGDDWEGRRNRVVVMLYAGSLLRRSEIQRARIEDVNFSSREIVLRRTKDGHDHAVPVTPGTLVAIRKWMALRPAAIPEDLLICSHDDTPLALDYLTHLVRRLSKRAGLPHIYSPHDLRHFGACEVLRQSGNLELCQKLLRHKTLHTTLRYARLLGTDVRAQFRRYAPID